MLYDQAQLVLAFLDAAQVSGDEFFADVANDTLQYVRREMTDPLGGFYSAEDADSVPPERASRAGPSGPAKSEGAFYLWTDEEIGRLLGDDADLFRRRYGVEPAGNAPADPQQEFTGKNLLMSNLTGNPCVVLPAGFSKTGTPTSICFIGKLFGEAELLAAAKKFQDATDFHRRHPTLD